MTRERKVGTETGLIRARDACWGTVEEKSEQGIRRRRGFSSMWGKVYSGGPGMLDGPINGGIGSFKYSMYIVIGLSKYEHP